MQIETNTVVLRVGWIAISFLVMMGLTYILFAT